MHRECVSNSSSKHAMHFRIRSWVTWPVSSNIPHLPRVYHRWVHARYSSSHFRSSYSFKLEHLASWILVLNVSWGKSIFLQDDIPDSSQLTPVPLWCFRLLQLSRAYATACLMRITVVCSFLEGRHHFAWSSLIPTQGVISKRSHGRVGPTEGRNKLVNLELFWSVNHGLLPSSCPREVFNSSFRFRSCLHEVILLLGLVALWSSSSTVYFCTQASTMHTRGSSPFGGIKVSSKVEGFLCFWHIFNLQDCAQFLLSLTQFRDLYLGPSWS